MDLNLPSHHIIPWELANHPVVQKAAKSERAFHFNTVGNGIPIPKTNHLAGHGTYNPVLRNKLDILQEGTLDNLASAKALENLSSQIRALIHQIQFRWIHEALGINPQDYLFFAPVSFAAK